jgi:hypothetical protein
MTTRNERLSALRTAVEQWADAELERLNAEVEYLERVKEAASASGQLADSSQARTQELLEDEINAYLV